MAENGPAFIGRQVNGTATRSLFFLADRSERSRSPNWP